MRKHHHLRNISSYEPPFSQGHHLEGWLEKECRPFDVCPEQTPPFLLFLLRFSTQTIPFSVSLCGPQPCAVIVINKTPLTPPTSLSSPSNHRSPCPQRGSRGRGTSVACFITNRRSLSDHTFCAHGMTCPSLASLLSHSLEESATAWDSASKGKR